jgi:hypothetical protein
MLRILRLTFLTSVLVFDYSLCSEAGESATALIRAGLDPSCAHFGAMVSAQEGNFSSMSRFGCAGAFQFCPGILDRSFNGTREAFINDQSAQITIWSLYMRKQWELAKETGITSLSGTVLNFLDKTKVIDDSAILMACHNFGCGKLSKVLNYVRDRDCNAADVKDLYGVSVCASLLRGAGEDVSCFTGRHAVAAVPSDHLPVTSVPKNSEEANVSSWHSDTVIHSAGSSCLDDVARFAIQICGELDKTGASSVTDTSGQLTSSTSSIVARIVGNGSGAVSGTQARDTYNNVLREQLGGELFDVRKCRLSMVHVGVEQLCKVRPTEVVSKPSEVYSRNAVESKLDKFIGRWINDGSGESIDIRENGDLLDDRLGTARIAPSVESASNYAVYYRGFTCLYYVTFTSEVRMVLALRKGTKSCLKGLFDRVTSP